MEYMPFFNDTVLIAKPLLPVVYFFTALLGVYFLFSLAIIFKLVR